jgi:hypothetical protein
MPSALRARSARSEDYRVEIDGAPALELRTIPHIGGGDARASLKLLRLG